MRLISIGRSRSSTIYIPSEFVSANHAELIILDNGDIFLVDCNSKHGTYLFGKRIQPYAEVPVKRGDKIEFDDVPLNWANVPVVEVPDPKLVKGVYGVGKNPRNKYRLSGDSVSRYHATIKEMKNGKWYIQDHSTNGTYLNGERITPNQDYRLTNKDSIICGVEPCPNPVPRSSLWKFVVPIVAAAVVLLALLIIPPPININFDPAKATVLVQQDYFIKVNFQDKSLNTFLGEIDWYVVKFDDGNGNYYYDLVTSKELLNLNPIPESHCGTAFFISDDGFLVTNKHVADGVWADKVYNNGREAVGLHLLIDLCRKNIANEILDSIYDEEEYVIMSGLVSLWVTSPFTLESEIISLGVAYPGRRYIQKSELDKAYVVDKSSNDMADVALLRLNSHKTPEYADYFNLSRCVDDITKLKGDANYYTLGYPSGVQLVDVCSNNNWEPTKAILHIIKTPGEYSILMDGDQTIGGQSGSPVYDKKKRLIGVLYGGLISKESTLVCPIKHVLELVEGPIRHNENTNKYASSNR